MSTSFNYKHLYYFWVVAKEGGMSRAADKLDMAVQTVSAQVRELERSLGYALLKPAGRGLVLTDAGQTALQLADQIFQIGENLPERVRESASAPSMRLAVGISDGLPKLVARRLLQPVISEPTLRLICHEGELDELLGDLALHRLDVVFSDRPAPANPNIKLYSHAMGQSPMAWYGTPALVDGAASHFPQCLASTPVLLPTAHTAVRARLDHWFEQQGVRPRIVGEFEDSALLNTFGASGMGIFPAAEWAEQDLLANYGVERLAPCEGVTEHFFAVGTEKKVQHPLVQRVLDGIA
ncbi:LysR family transcriptional regulator [Rhodoferax sp. TBRC 17660]|uniref:LysR family transcriptional regulator n=1 Tax=Rhodoferax potami TaxID=3068338 RepID=A0ABU3KKD1_9BURK|nr:LysR family transcriptional regulator [Rhodoferax sp. TBRC 17660]MDT7518206.1 LysR family transcriptional regulator [Rhodoferax sp. TBRC 17660]